MAERVLFEFRIHPEGDDIRYEFRHAQGIFNFTHTRKSLHPSCFAGRWHAAPGSPPRPPSRSRRGMRQALDFLEKMYGDLYGESKQQSE